MVEIAGAEIAGAEIAGAEMAEAEIAGAEMTEAEIAEAEIAEAEKMEEMECWQPVDHATEKKKKKKKEKTGLGIDRLLAPYFLFLQGKDCPGHRNLRALHRQDRKRQWRKGR